MHQDSTLSGFMSVLTKEGGWDVTTLVNKAKNLISPENKFNAGVYGVNQYLKGKSFLDLLGANSDSSADSNWWKELALGDPDILKGVNSVVGPKYYNAFQVNPKGGINMTSPLGWNYSKFFGDHPIVSSVGALGLAAAGGSLVKGLFGRNRNQSQPINRSNMPAPSQPYRQMNFEKYSG